MLLASRCKSGDPANRRGLARPLCRSSVLPSVRESASPANPASCAAVLHRNSGQRETLLCIFPLSRVERPSASPHPASFKRLAAHTREGECTQCQFVQPSNPSSCLALRACVRSPCPHHPHFALHATQPFALHATHPPSLLALTVACTLLSHWCKLWSLRQRT